MPLINIDCSFDNKIYQIKYRPVTRPVGTWRQEILATAKSIYESTDRPIYVGMSGGIDGEAVARLYLELGLPFTAISLRYQDGENDHDLIYAQRFCQTHNISHQIINIDPKKLYGPIMQDFLDQGYQAANIYRYLQLYILDTVEKLGGTAVLAAGEQVYYTDGQDIYIASSPELLLSLDYCQRNNSKHYVNFFMYSPEMYAAYLNIKLIDTLVNNPKLCRNTIEAGEGFAQPINSTPEKPMIYRREWPDMIMRPKYHGFEKINDWRNQIQQDLMQRFPEIKSVYIPVKTIKQQLGI